MAHDDQTIQSKSTEFVCPSLSRLHAVVGSVKKSRLHAARRFSQKAKSTEFVCPSVSRLNPHPATRAQSTHRNPADDDDHHPSTSSSSRSGSAPSGAAHALSLLLHKDVPWIKHGLTSDRGTGHGGGKPLPLPEYDEEDGSNIVHSRRSIDWAGRELATSGISIHIHIECNLACHDNAGLMVLSSQHGEWRSGDPASSFIFIGGVI